MASPASAVPGRDQGTAKDDAREHRLRRTNTIKERIFGEWQKHCLKVCDDDVRVYWICRQEQGLLAPLKCGEENKVMQACLTQCTQDEEKFSAYKARRLDEIEALALGRVQAVQGGQAGAGAGAAGAGGKIQ